MPRPAVVMNMFYTGLGIARSLGERGIPVVGLTAHRGIYGNFTRYARVRSSPDSRQDPEALLAFFLELAKELPERAVVFPTRDDDVLFLDRFRAELGPRFDLVLPRAGALAGCLDKSVTYDWATRSGIPAPRCWRIDGTDDLLRIAPELRFPCVLKPISAHHWRKAANWEAVGHRKAIPVHSVTELLAEYGTIGRAESRALLQEMVPGGDDCLWIAACYIGGDSDFVAGFTARKRLQVPEGFGTGCIIEAVDRPDLLDYAARLLRTMGFSGIAEVEFKWDAASGDYKLIEINPRPWDQHSLGRASGVDLIHIAYCDRTGLPLPPISKQSTGHKWIAEDVFILLLLRSLWKRDGRFTSLLRIAAGPRVYSIWSFRDPVPFPAFFATGFCGGVIAEVARHAGSAFLRLLTRLFGKRELPYETPVENANCKR